MSNNHRITTIAAVMFGLLALTSCGADDGNAHDEAEAVVEAIIAGDCDDPPAAFADDDDRWTTVCTDLNERLTTAELDGDMPAISLPVTESHQTGEIGFDYTSRAVLNSVDGDRESLELCFVGTGFLGTTPALEWIKLSDLPVYDRNQSTVGWCAGRMPGR